MAKRVFVQIVLGGPKCVGGPCGIKVYFSHVLSEDTFAYSANKSADTSSGVVVKDSLVVSEGCTGYLSEGSR